MAVRKHKYIHCMDYAPVASISSGGAADGSDASVSHINLGPHSLELRYELANSDIVPVRTVDGDSTNGLELPNDNTDNEGGEFTFGIENDAGQPHVFTVGTDPAFFFRVKLGIPDVSDYDVLFIGFREVGSYVDAINAPATMLASYDEKAGLNIEAGDIHSQTSLADSDTETDLGFTNWADDEVKEVTVKVASDGACTYELDGSTDSSAVSFTLADATVVTPCLVFCKGGTGSDTPPIIEEIEFGLQ